jgi:hypothetical protein
MKEARFSAGLFFLLSRVEANQKWLVVERVRLLHLGLAQGIVDLIASPSPEKRVNGFDDLLCALPGDLG